MHKPFPTSSNRKTALTRIALLVLILIGFSRATELAGLARQTEPDTNTNVMVASAIADGIERLGGDIRTRNIPNDGMTVDDFVKKTGSETELNDVVRKAERIGGPRWIDEQTCQVRLVLPGDRVAQALVKMATDHADRSPIKPEALSHDLADWKNLSFSANGSSIRADRAHALPAGVIGPNSPWKNVPEPLRQRAVEDAKAGAVKRILESVAVVPVGDTTAGDMIQDADPVRVTLEKWLSVQPFSNIVFRDDLRVSYTLSASGTQLFDQFVNAAHQAKIPLMLDQQSYAAARDEFGRRVLPTTGTNEGKGPIFAQPGPEPVVPAQQPDWVFQQIDGTGEAPFRESQLLTKQDAEDHATDAISAKLQALPLNKNETVRDAMKRDPFVRAAVRKALSRATITKVAFAADGGVSVKMVLRRASSGKH